MACMSVLNVLLVGLHLHDHVHHLVLGEEPLPQVLVALHHQLSERGVGLLHLHPQEAVLNIKRVPGQLVVA